MKEQGTGRKEIFVSDAQIEGLRQQLVFFQRREEELKSELEAVKVKKKTVEALRNLLMSAVENQIVLKGD